MLYADLFFSFCLISLLTYGGGYSALPLIESIAVTQKGWMTAGEITDMISIAEITPGVFSLNCSTFVGMRMAGWPGALIATLGFLFPSIVISLAIAVLFRRFQGNRKLRVVLDTLNACIVAVLLNTAIHIFEVAAFPNPGVDWVALGLFSVTFALLFQFRANPILVLLGSGFVGLVLYPFCP